MARPLWVFAAFTWSPWATSSSLLMELPCPCLPPENGAGRWLTLKHCWFHSHFHTQAPGFTYTGGLSGIKDAWVRAVCSGLLVEGKIPFTESSPCLLVWEQCADFCMCLSVLLWAWWFFVPPLSSPLWIVRIYSQSFSTWVTHEVSLCCMLGLWWAADLLVSKHDQTFPFIPHSHQSQHYYYFSLHILHAFF